MDGIEFKAFPKIPRLFREAIITEKIDGTNASIHIRESDVGEPPVILAASRTRFITPENDNFGFAMWVKQHATDLLKLGPGSHFGEWWGVGIQRGYELSERRFSLFHTHKIKELPSCCDVVPVLYEGLFETVDIHAELAKLKVNGSTAAPGYMKPEGVVIYHKAAGTMFKATLEGDKKG
jgi:hypothetical protein